MLLSSPGFDHLRGTALAEDQPEGTCREVDRDFTFKGSCTLIGVWASGDRTYRFRNGGPSGEIRLELVSAGNSPKAQLFPTFFEDGLYLDVVGGTVGCCSFSVAYGNP